MADFIERRRFVRYPVYCPIQYRCEDERMRDETIALNMSEGGILLSTKRLLGVAARLIVRVFFRKEDFAIPGRVVHIHPDGCDRKVYNVGVEFRDLPARFIQRFYEEINGIALYQARVAATSGLEVTMAEASMNWYKDSFSRWQ